MNFKRQLLLDKDIIENQSKLLKSISNSNIDVSAFSSPLSFNSKDSLKILLLNYSSSRYTSEYFEFF